MHRVASEGTRRRSASRPDRPAFDWSDSSADVFVSDAAALLGLHDHPRILRSRRASTFRLLLPDLPLAERSAWEAAALRFQRDCGCSTGAFFALGSAAIVAIREMLHSTPIGVGSLLGSALRVGAAMFAMGLIGKLVGLAAARVRFRRATTRVLRQLDRGLLTVQEE
jgi:hypothetical protein